ncbi:BolA family transcriptional regulator [Haematospirillum jordaniae]|uniref:BolA family protein n=1 Tax=Haematospirillum jordaniae TaxID=1549855 RepID=UPI0014332761|nr:BolA family protein [Haematospirillum jordaniae]NKD85812.1 BolA family transcriptional regulator [Haematospirillum jordaniae]
MTFRDRIHSKLTVALSPVFLDIRDDSARHAGHADRIAALAERGADTGHAPLDGGGETHFTVTVVSAAFEGKSRVERQRLVYTLLADELRERVHALSIMARTPAEASTL